ncbi:MAG TPA: chloride channel protein [Cyclobacteriaceae bacterium]
MIERVHQVIVRFVNYFHESLTSRQFFILSSVLVGISAGLAAILLKFIVHYIRTLVEYSASNFEEFFLFTLFPLVGITATVLYVRFILKGTLKQGASEIVYSIVKQSSILPKSEMYSHIITSALTVGFGGSCGLESPIVSTGSAIGSNYAKTYRLSYKERTILLGCGAAAGIAAVFNAPIAGVLFAIEVLLTEVTVSAFIPLIVAAATGALLSKIILQEGVILSFSLAQEFDYHNVPFYIILGLLAGLLSLYYAEAFHYAQHQMARIRKQWARVVAGGLILSVLLIFFPPLYGEGYETIKSLSNLHPSFLIQTSLLNDFLQNDWQIVIFLAALVFLKAIAAGITIGAGGNGGNFGPSLFMGAYLGFAFSRTVNMLGLGNIPETNFTLVGMAGILSGIFHAPLTAIFLIAEITGGYGLMIPLMIVSAISILMTHFFQPLSMEGQKLSSKLKVSVDDRDKYLLSKLDLTDLIEKSFLAVKPDDKLRDLVRSISLSKRNTFPVVNEDGTLAGIIHLDNVRDTIFRTELYDKVTVKELMTPPASTISPSDNLHTVLKKFDETNEWNLPMVEKGRYIGFLSKASILAKYRSELLRSV